jgi:eukaryotic-like serine/threonine-protein kinase
MKILTPEGVSYRNAYCDAVQSIIAVWLVGTEGGRMGMDAGTKLGPYEIVGPLGAGGMGEVYRARDTRLGRDVAIKVLPTHLSENSEAKQRFEREAKAVSSLSHANICPLFDVGSQDGVEYLVMEYLEGETLAARLAKGPLKMEEVQRIGVEIADALEKAHRQGIVHRDLKPGNVMLTKSGAKLMDFGLAKPSMAMTAASDLMTPSGPTMSVAALTSATSPLTQKGMIVGTFQYIAPEVLQGKEADARSDIFSLGCVLFEMATGKRAFEGKSQLSVFTAILENEPVLVSSLQPLSPKGLDEIVKNCLAKDPEERISSAHDVKLQLRGLDAKNTGTASAVVPAPAAKRSAGNLRFLYWAATALALLAAAGLGYTFAGKKEPDAALRVQITPPDKASFRETGDLAGAPVLSPQGDKLAFTADGPNSPKALWVRSLDSFAAQRLEGTDDAMHPFWSPDGRYIGFFAKGKLNKVLATGGPVMALADAANPRGGAWCEGDVIVYTPSFQAGLKKVSASGGSVTDLTTLDPTKHTTHRWPSCLPGGKGVLYLATNHTGAVNEGLGVYDVGLDGKNAHQVAASDAGGQYANGYLLYHVQTALMAQPFDPETGKTSGDPATVIDKVRFDAGVWRVLFSVSQNGRLAYFPGGDSAAGTVLALCDRTGKVLRIVGPLGSYMDPVFSPDGKRLAFLTGDPLWSVWTMDIERGTRTRITFDQTVKTDPAWSPDGKTLAYVGQTGGTDGVILSKAANVTGSEQTLVAENGVGADFPQFSPDGKYLVYLRQKDGRPLEIVAKPPAGGEALTVVKFHEPATALPPYYQVSPNGKWLAYGSAESGTHEVYIVPFPKGDGKWQVSSGGGTVPKWSHDGKEVYYMTVQGQVYAAGISERGNELQIETPKLLFNANIAAIGTLYDVSPDGTFIVQQANAGSQEPLNLITNWAAELKK